MSKKDFFLDEKQIDFLVLAVDSDSDARFLAFRYDDNILIVEDIPLNYPRVSIFNTTEEKLKNIVKDLENNDWYIIVNKLQ